MSSSVTDRLCWSIGQWIELISPCTECHGHQSKGCQLERNLQQRMTFQFQTSHVVFHHYRSPLFLFFKQIAILSITGRPKTPPVSRAKAIRIPYWIQIHPTDQTVGNCYIFLFVWNHLHIWLHEDKNHLPTTPPLSPQSIPHTPCPFQKWRILRRDNF